MHDIGNCSDLRNVGHAQHWHLKGLKLIYFDISKAFQIHVKGFPEISGKFQSLKTRKI